MVLPIDSKLSLSGFVDSRQGGRTENQDSAGAKETPLGTLVVVCDGMGGMQGGSTASQMAVKAILDFMMQADSQSNPTMTLIKAIRNANMAVWQESQSNPELRGMGTTVTAILFSAKSAIAAYVGDSRIYQLRKGKKVFRSFDHSMVFEMVKKKVITEEQARLSAQSNIIMKALGITADVEVDTFELPYCKGDRFVLCSDGFWGAMPESEFITMLCKDNTVDRILEATANAVDAIGRKKGGDYDNLTAAIIEMNQNSKLKPKMTKLAKILLAILSMLLVVSVCFNIYLSVNDKPREEVKNPYQSRPSVRKGNKAIPTENVDTNKINPGNPVITPTVEK